MAALPEGSTWWAAAHPRVARALEAMQQGNPDEAAEVLGERFAPAAPDVWDSNWPEHKTWRVLEVPIDLRDGDHFLVGDGMGLRAVAQVQTRDGERGAVIIVGSVRHGLDQWYEPALDHAERLARADEDG